MVMPNAQTAESAHHGRGYPVFELVKHEPVCGHDGRAGGLGVLGRRADGGEVVRGGKEIKKRVGTVPLRCDSS